MAMNDETKANATLSEPGAVAPLASHFRWADDPVVVDRLIRWLSYACVLLVLFDILWPRYTKVPGEGLWGFYAIVGFLSCSLVVIGARFLRLFIRRDETVYGQSSVDGEAYPSADTDRCTLAEQQPDSLRDFTGQLLGREATGTASVRGGRRS